MDGFRRLPHLIIPAGGHHQPYRNPVGGGGSALPNRDRYRHAQSIRTQYERAKDAALAWLKDRDWRVATSGPAGIYLEILTAAYVPEAFEDQRHGIEVVAAIPDEEHPGITRVTIFIPSDQVHLFADKIDKYRYANTPKGKPRFQNFAARVDEFRFEDPLRALWTDQFTLFPRGTEPIWWEVWVRGAFDDVFIATAKAIGIEVRPGFLTFPNRIIRLVNATTKMLAKLVLQSGAVAEIRRSIDTPARLLQLESERQFDFIESLLARTEYADGGAPAVCLLDTGLNHQHPLLSRGTASVSAYIASWGTHDGEPHGHGTQMGGIALFGDLTVAIKPGVQLRLAHRLESVKVLPDDERDGPDLDLYGQVFRDSIRIVESTTQHRQRVFVSAITGHEEAWRGMPDSWSAQIDADCAESGEERLFIISAGNIDSSPAIYAPDYTGDVNDTTGILQPAQAWNALTVGAFTERCTITDKQYAQYTPVASSGGLCPQSRTSVLWEPQWPVKPDIVLEGGNYAKEPSGDNAYAIDDLMMLSTGADFRSTPFSSFGFTSGAAAVAANMCGRLRAQYPDLWPETIRGLVTHSAEWTETMLKSYGPLEADRRRLLGRYGYGVPNIERALWSLQHDITMMIEDRLQPFRLENGEPKNNRMVLYELPWPKDVLEPLGEADVQLRVTLSYYVEPNPARRGFKGRYLYASHGLRFEVKKASESIGDFSARINKLEREEGYENPGGDDEWFLKAKARNRGSLIQDVWRGSASDLAARSAVVIYPVTGWWRTAKHLGKVERQARFSLLMSLSVENRPEIDIYTPIAIQIAQPISTEISLSEGAEESTDDADES